MSKKKKARKLIKQARKQAPEIGTVLGGIAATALIALATEHLGPVLKRLVERGPQPGA